jgi:dihydrodipicolinate synthase/N-acetylneuraminate lyase
MDNSRSPRGLIVELITPLKNGSIDGTGLEKLLARTVPHAQALLLAGPRHGEGENMEMALRHELLKKPLMHSPDVPSPFCCGSAAIRKLKPEKTSCPLTNGLERLARKGGLFWVDTPLTYHSNRGLPEYYRELLAMVNIPLVLHNDPEAVHTTRTFKRHNIRTAVLKELVQNEGIAGLIFSGSLERAHHYQRACRSRQHFRLYDGDENRFLEHPSMGGVVSVGANLAPGAWETITQSSIQLHAHQENYPDRLQQIWESGDYLKQMVALSGQMPVAAIKTMLCDMGIIETAEMLQSSDIEPDGINALKRLMRDFGDYH